MKKPAFGNDKSGWMIWLGLIVVTWSALLAGSLVWDMRQLKQDTLNAATVAARANINKDLGFRKWAASHGGVYVPPTEHTPPNPYLKVPDRDVVTTTGKVLTLMNPAYMLRQLQSDFPDDYGTRSHITSLKPLNPNNAPDTWEDKALHGFEQGGKELLETQQIDGQTYLRMMLPLIVEQGCLKCHEQQGYKLGDIRGGISSAVPLEPFLARERESNTSMMLNHGAIWLLGLAWLAWLGVSFRRVQRLKILARTAAAVEESERRFRAIAQSANDAIISADSTGKVVGWNQSAERLFGYAEAEIIGQPMTLLMPERFRNPHRENLARVVAGGASHVIGKTVELVGLSKDGSEFPLEISLAQWGSADGQFFTAIIRDITERKNAEAAFQTLVETAVANIGAEFFRETIRSLSTWLGAECVIVGELVEGNRVRALAMQLDGKAIEHYEYALPSTPCESATEKGYCAYPEGVCQLFPSDKDLSDMGAEAYVGTPIRDKNGKVNGILCAISRHKFVLPAMTQGVFEIIAARAGTEIERQRTEKSLRNSETQLQTIVENITEGIAVSDLDGQLLHFNRAALDLHGFTTLSECRQHLNKFADTFELSAMDGAVLPLDQWPLARILRGESLRDLDLRIRHIQAGWQRVYSYGGTLVRDAEGQPLMAIITISDITERKLAEAKLAEQLDELRRWHDATSGREDRILVLKHEVNELLVRVGQQPRYPSAESDEQPADE